MLYYNQERKERYITERNADVTLIKTFLPRLFKNSKDFEIKYEKDICDFTTPEISNMLKTFSYTSVTTLIGDVSQYAIYTDWCMQNGFVRDGQNHFREINRHNAEEYVNRAIMNQSIYEPKDLRHWEVRLDNAYDIALLWLLFEGLTTEEIGELRPQDIVAVIGDVTTDSGEHVVVNDMSFDEIEALHPQIINVKNSMITTCNDRSIVVDSHVSEQMFECMQEMTYVMENGHIAKLRNDGHVFKPTIQSKGNTSAFQNGRRLRARVSRLSKSLGVNRLSQSTLGTSGLVWHIKQNTKEQGIGPREYMAGPEGKELLKQYGKGKASPSTIMLQLGEFLKDKEN